LALAFPTLQGERRNIRVAQPATAGSTGTETPGF
jgi:hypothetical protein